MSTISTIQLDSNYEPLFTSQPSDLLTDVDAVAQIIKTRLLLWVDEWWENLNDGVPMFQQILGQGVGNTPGVVEAILAQRILGTVYVTEILDISSSFDPTTRAFTFNCTVLTQFGAVAIGNSLPTPPPQGIL